jgi:hypothetical protein
MIFVQGHDIIAVFDKLKVWKFFLVDTEDFFVVLLFFLLLEPFFVEFVVQLEEVEGLVCG